MSRPELKRGKSNFKICGRVKIGKYSFPDTIISKNNSEWYGKRMSLRIACGEGNNVYVHQFGGNTDVYTFGRFTDHSSDSSSNDDTWYRTDFENRLVIPFDERFDEEWTSQVGSDRFYRASVQKVNPEYKEFEKLSSDEQKEKIKNKTAPQQYISAKSYNKNTDELYRAKFLSEMDLIEYLANTLEDGAKVFVSGDLEYELYQGEISLKKNITNISLVDEDAQEFSSFQQTIVANKKSIKGIDEDTNTCVLDVLVPSYNSSSKQMELYPLSVELYQENEERLKKTIKLLFGNIGNEDNPFGTIGVEGDILDGQVMEVTEDDVSDVIKEAIALGLISANDVKKSKRVVSQNYDNSKMIIKKPILREMRKEDGEEQKSITTLDMAKGVYSYADVVELISDDLPRNAYNEDIIDNIGSSSASKEKEVAKEEKEEEPTISSDDDWLSELENL